jgi:hypothetical protein
MSHQQQSNFLFFARARLGLLVMSIAMAFVHAAQATEVSSGMQNNPLVQHAVLDLAQRESISPEEIVLESFEEVVWPDTGMGCPLPGMRYKQVPQDGARIVLRVREEFREYHSGGNQAPFLCTFIPDKR